MAAQNGMVSEDILKKVKGWRGYVEAKLGFRNHWYPVRLAEDLADNEPIAFKLCGEDLLLNKIDDQFYCMRDRCLHRGVPLSRNIECHKKGTITCWYHGWTYDWESGNVVGILTVPQSSQIGRHRIKTYPVQVAKGIVFVFLGEIVPPPLAHDVPPNFLDEDVEVCGKVRSVQSNWRVGAENGFDAGHIWIHRKSILVEAADLALPVGFATPEGAHSYRIHEDPNGPQGVFDLLGEMAIPVFESYLGEEKITEGHFGENRVANEISIWLPGVLKVDPWPQQGMAQYEWYVPADATSHYYFQTIGAKVANEEERLRFREEFKTKWTKIALDGFNNDDVWAREAGEAFYANDVGWVEEILYEPDMAILEWRKFAATRNRGVQTIAHIESAAAV
jgi:carbazole 1,9a-dioxygenase terminal dioxygenase component